MAGLLDTPFLWIVGALIAYFITYNYYSKWVDEKIWEVNDEKPTPAHMYLDGVEFFPVSRYVLYGFQFKSIAALGPILGPYIGITYGWVPALLWIIFGNMFIGWVQDYSTIMLTVRNEGKSMGPLAYEFIGESGRNILLAYLLFYLLIISAVFIYLIALFWTLWVGSFVAMIITIITAFIVGQMLYKYKMNIFTVTIFAIILVFVAVVVGTWFDAWVRTAYAGASWLSNGSGAFFGEWSLYIWAIILAVFLFIASVASMPKFITPLNFVSFFPALGGVLLIIIATLLTPITGITVAQPAWVPEEAFTLSLSKVGPIFPILFVSIACGAISGWHSLVSTSTSGKQLDVESDARPVGAGAMLTEGLLATSALASYMVLTSSEISKSKVASFVAGATKLTASIFGAGTDVYLKIFFGLFLVIYAFTVQSLVTRYWRVFSAELFKEGNLSILGDKYIATFVGLLIPILFALSGSWINLWIYFGGSNQLLAGLALMLVVLYLTKIKKSSLYALIPAIFMIIVTLSALVWETAKFTYAVITGSPIAKPPLSNIPIAALALNAVFVIVGMALFLLGIYMTGILFKRYFEYKKS
ncbi:MAG: carbon starvation CstA family protein [Candidatus Njordarchaeia archaeon]